MKTFKAKHNKGFYKNTNSWIDAVYRNNKAIIDTKLANTGKPKATFKQMVKEYISEGMTPTKAVSTIARSTLFTPEVVRIKNNFYQGLLGDPSAYKAFRELTKVKGRYTKFDAEKLKWDKDEHRYIYDSSVIISFQNSPFGVDVRLV